VFRDCKKISENHPSHYIAAISPMILPTTAPILPADSATSPPTDRTALRQYPVSYALIHGQVSGQFYRVGSGTGHIFSLLSSFGITSLSIVINK